MGCGASATPAAFSPLAKVEVGRSRFKQSGIQMQVVQALNEQDEQDEALLTQLGAPVFRRTSDSSTQCHAFKMKHTL